MNDKFKIEAPVVTCPCIERRRKEVVTFEQSALEFAAYHAEENLHEHGYCNAATVRWSAANLAMAAFMLIRERAIVGRPIDRKAVETDCRNFWPGPGI